MSTISLTGKKLHNPLNLTGKSPYVNTSYSPDYIIKLKRIVFDRYITPILSKNFNILKENFFQINTIINKLEIYYEYTKDESLLVYIHILRIIKNTNDTIEELTTLEEKLFDNGRDLAKLTFKIPRIRLKPEMELYNLIIGKPDRNLYDKDILKYITELLKNEYITFNEIKEKHLEKYKLNKNII